MFRSMEATYTEVTREVRARDILYIFIMMMIIRMIVIMIIFQGSR